jgi:hypothetical protein
MKKVVSISKYAWKPDKRVPMNYWKNSSNHREFLDYLGSQLGITKMEDWYSVKKQHFMAWGGSSLLHHHHFHSPSKLLQSAYPLHPWLLHKFHKSPHRYWSQLKNQKEYLEWLGHHLHFHCWEDWYNLKLKDIKSTGGSGLLSKYGDSPRKIVENVFSDVAWQRWRFRSVDFVLSDSEKREIVGWIKNRMQIIGMQEWFRISKKQWRNLLPSSAVKYLVISKRSPHIPSL